MLSEPSHVPRLPALSWQHLVWLTPCPRETARYDDLKYQGDFSNGLERDFEAGGLMDEAIAWYVQATIYLRDANNVLVEAERAGC